MKPKKLNARNLTNKQVKELLQQPSWTVEEELSKQLKCTAYVSTEDRVLLHREVMQSRLYENKQDLLDLLKQGKKRFDQQVLWYESVQRQEFASRIPRLLDELGQKLGISATKLDYTLESLGVIDAKLNQRKREEYFKQEVFAALVAYVGETIKKATNGQWCFKTEATNNASSANPIIFSEHSALYDPAIIVFRELSENTPCCLQDVVTGEINIKRAVFRNQETS